MEENITLSTNEYNELMGFKEKHEGLQNEVARLKEANNTLTREKADLQRAFLNGSFSKNNVGDQQETKTFQKFVEDLKR